MTNKKTDKDLFTEALGNRIKYLRELNELSLMDVAYKLQIEPNSLRRYERGDTLMNAFYLVKIAEVIGVTLDELTKDLK